VPAIDAPPAINTTTMFYHTVYYADAEGHLVPVLCTFEKTPSRAKTALSALVDNAQNTQQISPYGLRPTIPQEVTISLALKEDGLIKVGLGAAVMQLGDPAKEEALLKSIVYTLTEFDNISAVEFLIGSRPATSLTGGTNASGTFRREDINSTQEKNTYRTTLYTYGLYYPDYYFYPQTVYTEEACSTVDDILALLTAQSTFILNADDIIISDTMTPQPTVEIRNTNLSQAELTAVKKCILLTLQENTNISSCTIHDGQRVDTYAMPIVANML
jgi:germination protein M